MRVGIVVESGEPREVMHYALLVGYGAGAVNPYLAIETIEDLIATGQLKNVDASAGGDHYLKAANKGILKVMTKMGISTLQSYRGAQIFEAIGLNRELIDKYFTWTASRIEGIGLEAIASETAARHAHAFEVMPELDGDLDVGGQYQWRRRGEFHMYNPTVTSGADRRGRAGERDREALQDRGDVLRLDLEGGAREPRDRDEPHRRQVEHRRGR